MHQNFIKLRASTHAVATLIWLPHAGGSSVYFEGLSTDLPEGIESLGIDYPGRGRRRREPLQPDLMKIAREVAVALATLNGPYVVFGHSMGALVGYEACRLIEAAGDVLPKLLIVSSCDPPHLAINSPLLHRLKDEALIERISVMGGVPELAGNGEELLRLNLPILRSDVTATEMHRFVPWPRTRQNLAIYAGRYDVMVDPVRVRQWNKLTAGTARARDFEGGHFYMLEDPTAFVSALTRDVLESATAT